MKPLFVLLLLLICHSCSRSLKYRNHNNPLVGNNIIEFVQNKDGTNSFTDPIDDKENYQLLFDNIYKDTANKLFRLCTAFNIINKDSLLSLEYYKDYSGFIDLSTYRPIKDNYFKNKGKVYLWWGNSDGDYPIEIKTANAETFVPFKDIAGGFDKTNVYYGKPPSAFEIVEGANPQTTKVLQPKTGCWNCGNCYFVDHQHVFYGAKKLAGADAKTFRLVNADNVDAEDQYGKYVQGKPVKR